MTIGVRQLKTGLNKVMARNLIDLVSKTCGHRQADSGRIKPGSETVNNPDPDAFRPQNQRSRTQNPKQTRPQPLWIGVREAGPPIRVQEARGDIPGPWIWVTVCSGMGEGAIRGGYWGGRRAVGGEMDTAARCGAGFSGCQDHPWDSLN